MLPAVAIALGLAQLAPEILPLFSDDSTAQQVAEKSAQVAGVLTGKPISSAAEAAEAAATLQADPALLAQFRAEMLTHYASVVNYQKEEMANARQREIETGDKTPAKLAYINTVGFYITAIATLCLLIFARDLSDAAIALLGVFLNQVGNMAQSPNGYYFGSSLGSKVKEQTMRIMKK